MDIGALEQDEEFVAKVRDLKDAYLADKERQYIEQTYKFSRLKTLASIQGLFAGVFAGTISCAFGVWTNSIANQTNLDGLFLFFSFIGALGWFICTSLIKDVKAQ